jgi:(heptosyl)LPS beta-1,4-glucosyltransferase
MARLPVTGVVITLNEADRIQRCVHSLAAVCEDVVVLDSGSSDDTVALAQAAGARVLHQDWLGFSGQKNAAIAQATQPWVLLLDADEWLRDGASLKLAALFNASGSAAAPVESADVWRLCRRTRFLGSPLRFGGWGCESVDRLFRADLRYLPADVHEALDLAGRRLRRVDAWIEHETARSHAEYVAKLDRYAALWARQRVRAGKRAGATSAPLHAAAYFLKNYVMRGGFLDGDAGWRYHLAHARYVWQKYEQLRSAA